MHSVVSRLTQSTSIKVFTIAFLILVLLIPVAMIKGVINERSAIGRDAKQDIMRTWGQSQLVAGPILVLPYEFVARTQYGEPVIEKSRAYLLPEDLGIDVTIHPEIRYRGLHKVPIYSADIRLSGSIARPTIDGLDIDATTILWGSASVSLGHEHAG